MILPINSDPAVIAYGHHAYINAILGNDDLLCVIIQDSAQYEWKEFVTDTELHWKEDILSIRRKNHGLNTEGFLYRACEDEDELVVNIKYFQTINTNAMMNLIISGGDLVEGEHKGKDIYRLGLTKYGCFLTWKDKTLPYDNEGRREYTWLKVTRRNREVESYISEDGTSWRLINQEEIFPDADYDQLEIGINFNFGEDQYYSWLYMNYVQLVYDAKDLVGQVYLDYYMYPSKNYYYGYHYASQFLDIEYEKAKDILDLYGSLKNYINWCLKHFYYVSVCFDEFYLPERPSYYREHFFHHNLVYGYVEETKEYLLLGYHIKIMTSRISEQELEKMTISMEAPFIRYKYDPNFEALHFNVKRYAHSIKDFIGGINSSEDICNILPCKSGVYGLKVFNELIGTEEGNQLLIEDVRLSYVLYEHCKIMSNRLQFLYEKGYLSTETRESMTGRCQEMLDSSKRLNKVVIKNTIVKNLDDRIISSAKTLYQHEKLFYTELLDELKNT